MFFWQLVPECGKWAPDGAKTCSQCLTSFERLMDKFIEKYNGLNWKTLHILLWLLRTVVGNWLGIWAQTWQSTISAVAISHTCTYTFIVEDIIAPPLMALTGKMESFCSGWAVWHERQYIIFLLQYLLLVKRKSITHSTALLGQHWQFVHRISQNLSTPICRVT